MYTEDDLKLADKILVVIKKSNAIKDSELFRNMREVSELDEKIFTQKIRSLWKGMQALDLIDCKNNVLSLTLEGHNAASHEGGVKGYLEDMKNANKKETLLKRFQIAANYVSFAIWCILLILVVLYLLGIIGENHIIVKGVKFLLSFF